MNYIQKYFTYHNIIKQDYIEFLQICAPMFVSLDGPKRNQIIDLLNTLFFGTEEKIQKEKSQVEILKDLEKSLAKIKTLGAVELPGAVPNNILSQIKNG